MSSKILTKSTKLNALLRSISFIAMYILFGALLSTFKSIFSPEFERYAQGIVGTLGVLITVLIFLKVEKRSFKDYGLNWEKPTLKKFSYGLLFGIIISMILMGAQILYSDLELTYNSEINISHFFFWSLAFIPLAFMEEVAFRSYPLIELNKVFGLRITQFILAILFALYHMLMMWSPTTSLLGPGIWALAYALTAVMSGGIALPTGLHFGLNFVQSILGGQEGIDPLWEIDYPSNVSEEAIKANELFGVGTQVFVLIVCVIATEIYIRKQKNQLNSK